MIPKTVIDRLEISPATSIVSIRFAKQIISATGEVVASEYHRAILSPAIKNPDGTITPATNRSAYIAAVSAHLIALGFPAVSAADQTTIQNYDALSGRTSAAPVAAA